MEIQAFLSLVLVCGVLSKPITKLSEEEGVVEVGSKQEDRSGKTFGSQEGNGLGSILEILGRILGSVTETIVSVVATKIQIVQSLSSSGVVAGAVEGAAKGGAVLAEEGPGLVSAGVNLASQLIKLKLLLIKGLQQEGNNEEKAENNV
eukprot:TRINITY_DN3643_c0_g1_i4.p1 TRINITY_DN3643_c0_g1~~TRINITY_DN3643_c0_g1_i4.p1  ORF type:complete len:148 (-),score=45.03 TRINITY_DN3643_c0_g1_i4:29-472(-)